MCVHVLIVRPSKSNKLKCFGSSGNLPMKMIWPVSSVLVCVCAPLGQEISFLSLSLAIVHWNIPGPKLMPLVTILFSPLGCMEKWKWIKNIVQFGQIGHCWINNIDECCFRAKVCTFFSIPNYSNGKQTALML